MKRGWGAHTCCVFEIMNEQRGKNTVGKFCIYKVHMGYSLYMYLYKYICIYIYLFVSCEIHLNGGAKWSGCIKKKFIAEFLSRIINLFIYFWI